MSPGVANLALNLRATTYQLYDPIQTTEPRNISSPVCKWDDHHSTVSQTWSEDQEEQCTALIHRRASKHVTSAFR